MCSDSGLTVSLLCTHASLLGGFVSPANLENQVNSGAFRRLARVRRYLQHIHERIRI